MYMAKAAMVISSMASTMVAIMRLDCRFLGLMPAPARHIHTLLSKTARSVICLFVWIVDSVWIRADRHPDQHAHEGPVKRGSTCSWHVCARKPSLYDKLV